MFNLDEFQEEFLAEKENIGSILNGFSKETRIESEEYREPLVDITPEPKKPKKTQRRVQKATKPEKKEMVSSSKPAIKCLRC